MLPQRDSFSFASSYCNPPFFEQKKKKQGGFCNLKGAIKNIEKQKRRVERDKKQVGLKHRKNTNTWRSLHQNSKFASI